MPRQKDLKRIIRARMKKTGESYTAARARIIAKRDKKPLAAPQIDYGALAGMSDDTIATRTGRTWREWVDVLDRERAADMPHREIARLVHDRYGIPNWWTQAVTVGYERIKGLRQRGQRRDGAYEANKTKTFNVPVRTLFDAWATPSARRRWLGEAKATVRSSTAPKAMRLQWPDGTIVAVYFVPKDGAKSTVAVQHMKLADRSAMDEAKRYWADRLDALAATLRG